MFAELLNFGYVSQMDPRAALHMGLLMGLIGKKTVDFGLQKAGEYRQSKKK